jgi:hypothetical protein
MAEAAVESPAGLPWTQRLYDALPVAPVWTGLALAAALTLAFLAQEVALDRFTALGELPAEVRPWRDVRLAIVNFLLVAYLPTAFVYVGRGARSTRAALAPLGVRRSSQGPPGRYPTASLRLAGWIGVAATLFGPLLAIGTPNPYDPTLWTPEVVWHRALAPVIGWWGGRFVYAVLEESGRLSELARQLPPLDLFDLRPLAPFASQGLRDALLVIGLVAISTLFLSESGFALMIALLAALTLPVALTALLLPVRGARQRVREAKARELDWCRERLREERTRLGGASQAPGAPGRLEEILAYRAFVESVHEWPFDTSTLWRFALYLLIPLGSWSGGALVEHVIDALLD